MEEDFRSMLGRRLDSAEPAAIQPKATHSWAHASKTTGAILAIAAIAAFTFAASAASRNDENSRKAIGGLPTPGPLVIAEKSLESYPSAEISGPLLVKENCAMISDRVALFPKGTIWRSADQTVITPDRRQEHSVGQSFTGGGGEVPEGGLAADDIGERAARALASCVEATGAAGLVLIAP